VRADPNHAAEKQDDEKRDRPDNELDAAGINEAGLIARPRVGGAKPPGKDQDADSRWNDDDQHNAEGIEQDLAVGGADRPLRLKNAFGAAGQCAGGDDENRKAGEPISCVHADKSRVLNVSNPLSGTNIRRVAQWENRSSRPPAYSSYTSNALPVRQRRKAAAPL